MKKGFTLIEFMIVVVIIAILASIIVPALMRARANEKAKVDAAKAAIYKPTVSVLPEAPKPDVRIKQRFKYIESGAVGEKGQHPIYIVRDEETNRSYLMIVGAGITEMNTEKQQ